MSMGDQGSHSTEKAIFGSVKVFTERVVLLIQNRIPSAWLFRDQHFSDTPDGMFLNSKVTKSKDEASSSILDLQFRINDGVMDRGFLVCVVNGKVIAKLPTGGNGSGLTDKNTQAVVNACLGVLDG